MSAADDQSGRPRSPVRTVAPAKLNLTLEVLGKREDGFHDLASIVQTVDLVDDVFIEAASERSVQFIDEGGRRLPVPRNELIGRAWDGLVEAGAIDERASVTVVKRIPEAAGLGGGSSDAAAFLRLAQVWWGLGSGAPSEDGSLMEVAVAVAVAIGSDVPLFLTGGTVLMEGRGERVRALPEPSGEDAPWSALVFTPELPVPEAKTATMFGALRPSHYAHNGSGARTEALRRALEGGASSAKMGLSEALREVEPYNTLDLVADEVLVGLRETRRRMGAATHRVPLLGVPLLAGAGPSLFVSGERGTFEGMVASLGRGRDGVWVVEALPGATARRVWDVDAESIPRVKGVR
jgi:4-diphosphocytidyl-2-C-methyl-D-erythritol kinase